MDDILNYPKLNQTRKKIFSPTTVIRTVSSFDGRVVNSDPTETHKTRQQDYIKGDDEANDDEEDFVYFFFFGIGKSEVYNLDRITIACIKLNMC